MGVAALAEELSVDEGEAMRLADSFRRTYAGVGAMMSALVVQARSWFTPAARAPRRCARSGAHARRSRPAQGLSRASWAASASSPTSPALRPPQGPALHSLQTSVFHMPPARTSLTNQEGDTRAEH